MNFYIEMYPLASARLIEKLPSFFKSTADPEKLLEVLNSVNREIGIEEKDSNSIVTLCIEEIEEKLRELSMETKENEYYR
jgi:hypothetical protein